ncbi:hypothetical protein ASD21_00990 [Caulobacter sp. Root1455]|uniref:hypothetical protein n=1 Tax=Caulobacter sp. Root1455 TaxID=1736465 RepID=UPI0006F8D7C4|nr:hypothetical protein [Caulobacter sp. Root1455]KQZ06243.1 hypothetical protein ASD21_00990 [Caulobacter sp. Root1455]
MTQAQDIPTWSLTFQLKLMAALDAVWAILEASDDPAEIRRARDKAKACGELAAVARKVAQMVPTPRGKPQMAEAVAGMATTQAVATVQEMMAAMSPPTAAPVAAQAEHARRALDKLKGGRRGRL